MSDTVLVASNPRVSYKWNMRKLKVPMFMGPTDKRGTDFTVIAKTFGNVAVYPSIKMDSDGKGVEYLKDSYSVVAIPCRFRITWTRDEADAFKIAEFMATMFPIELSYRTPDKVMAGLPKWVAAWIKECRKAGSTKGGYVAPPETTVEIELLLEKYNKDRGRYKR